MLSTNSDKNWELLGEEDPYFGVLTEEKFRQGNFDEKVKFEFFESGERHVELVVAIIKKIFDSTFDPTRCLDFGCGVGRMVIPMAKRFHTVIGMDVSANMLKEAIRNCEMMKIRNAEFVQSDDDLSRLSGKFDFIHSFIVFQHISCSRGEKILARLLDLLDINGVAVLHFTYEWKASRFRKCAHWIRKSIPLVRNFVNLLNGRRFGYPGMNMNHYDLNRIFCLIQEKGFNNLYTHFMNDEGHFGVVLYIQKIALYSQKDV